LAVRGKIKSDIDTSVEPVSNQICVKAPKFENSPQGDNGRPILETNPNDDCSTVTIRIEPPVDLRIRKTHEPKDCYLPGSIVSYTLEIENYVDNAKPDVLRSKAKVVKFKMNEQFPTGELSNIGAFKILPSSTADNPGAFDEDTHVWTGVLKPGQKIFVRIDATISPITPADTKIVNHANLPIDRIEDSTGTRLDELNKDNNTAYDEFNATNPSDARCVPAPLPTADLGVVKSVKNRQTAYNIGDMLEYRFVITNYGDVSASSFTLEDGIPAQLQLQPGTWDIVTLGDDASEYTNAASPGNVAAKTNPSGVIWTGTINKGQKVVIRVNAKIMSVPANGADIPNTACISNMKDPNGGNLNDSVSSNNCSTTNITPKKPDLALIKSIDNGTAFKTGDMVKYRLVVTNTGTVAAKTFNIKETFPAQITPKTPKETYWLIDKTASTVNPTDANNKGTLTFATTGNDFTWNGGGILLQPGQKIAFTIESTLTGTLAAGEKATNNACVKDMQDENNNTHNPDGNPANDCSTADITPPVGDLKIVKSHDAKNSYNQNDVITYYFEITNPGQMNATSVKLTETFPTQLVPVTGSWKLEETKTTAITKGTFDATTKIWTGLIQAGTDQKVVISVQATLTKNLGLGEEVKNNACISDMKDTDGNYFNPGTKSDGNTGNNCSDDVIKNPSINVAIVRTGGEIASVALGLIAILVAGFGAYTLSKKRKALKISK